MHINALSEVLLFVGLVLIVLWIVVRIFPPKGINAIYGYRTPRSKRDKDSWDHAQKLSNRYTFRLAMVFLILGILFLFIDISMWSPYLIMALAISSLILGFGVMIFMVEKSLRRTFPKAN